MLEGFDLTGGSFRCLYLHGDGLVVRDTVVHHCPAHGILGADNDSGDATLERVEVHHAGNGTGEHSIYMATDEIAHPGSVFRMRNCWVHDSTGGNLVKSRAERNEIYYNRLEGNDLSYHELELIGPDPGGGSVPAGVREDSDVVGNLLVHRRSDFRSAARVGGDATGESEGRYRFVANTFLGVASAPSFTVFRAFDRLESIEAVGNVMHRPGGVQVMREVEAVWVSGATLALGVVQLDHVGVRAVAPAWARRCRAPTPASTAPGGPRPARRSWTWATRHRSCRASNRRSPPSRVPARRARSTRHSTSAPTSCPTRATAHRARAVPAPIRRA